MAFAFCTIPSVYSCFSVKVLVLLCAACCYAPLVWQTAQLHTIIL
uniref:Uncharacterized protein n=1 Tax=Anguilla anguilla TaxID=7936 RepID=A0A0E9V0B5_ANGAN